jgi:hypothetical protein
VRGGQSHDQKARRCRCSVVKPWGDPVECQPSTKHFRIAAVPRQYL